MTKGTPQPTDKCGRPECGKTYSAHLPPFASCPGIANLLNDRSFTPVPSPDSVKDMGEVTKHTPGLWTVLGKASHGWNVGVPGMVIATVYSYDALSDTLPNAELIAAAPATAARLEEVLAENQRLRETNNKLSDALESSGGFDVGFEYGADASGIKELRAEVERYREALRALTYDYRAHCNGVETPGLYRAESLLLGATEQSTEQ